MPATSADTPTVVALTTAGVSLVMDVSAGRLPAIVHWGPAVGDLDDEHVVALVASSTPPPGLNDVDVPVRVAVLPEHAAGWTGRPGLQGSRDGVAWSTRFTTTSLTLDGSVLSGVTCSGPGELLVSAVDDEAELALEVDIALLPSGLIRSRASLTNTGAEAYTLDGLVLAYPTPAAASELLDFSGRWGRERVPQRQPLQVGTHLRENRKGRTGADSAYVLHVGTPGFGFASGDVYAVHTAYSGNHVHFAERTFNGHRVIGGGELLLSGEVRLAQGEHYISPWIYGACGTGLDEIARRFHGHVRSRPRRVSSERPVTLNVWEAVHFDHRLDRLIDLAERAAKVGVERFVLDDGWFGARRHERAGLGDWTVSPDAWPDGLHPLADHVRDLGMQFGLWFEPEMVNPDSDLARAHPDWIMSARREWPLLARHQQVLNLGIPAAFDYVKAQLSEIVGEYRLDYVKWDHNRDLVEAGDQLDHGRPAVHRQTHSVYRLLDELRAAHPDVEIESCSSGGARIDLGILEHTDRVWVSDCIDPLERQSMMRWTTQLIPPEYMGSHIASSRSQTTGRVHDLSFRAGTAVFGHLGIEWDLAEASAHELDELREWLDFYKANRWLLLNGDVVRMDGDDDNLLLHGVVAPDRSEAIFAMAVVGTPDASPGARLRFRGLDPQRSYLLRPLRVGSPPSGLRAPRWWDDPGAVLSGATLEHVGVAAPIVHPDQVILFHAKRLRGS